MRRLCVWLVPALVACGAQSESGPAVEPAAQPSATAPPVATIPGTDLADTPENRAIVDVVERYRVAFKEADLETLLALASPDYLDDAGTPESHDDIDHSALSAALRSRLSADLVDLRMRTLRVSHEQARRVVVDFGYEMVFDVAGTRQARSDVAQLVLEPHDASYRILSGM